MAATGSVPVSAFASSIPVIVRLTDVACAALGIPATEVNLTAAQLQDGWFLATYQNGDGSLTKYLLSPSVVLYAKQDVPGSSAPPPQQG